MTRGNQKPKVRKVSFFIHESQCQREATIHRMNNGIFFHPSPTTRTYGLTCIQSAARAACGGEFCRDEDLREFHLSAENGRYRSCCNNAKSTSSRSRIRQPSSSSPLLAFFPVSFLPCFSIGISLVNYIHESKFRT